MRVRIALARQSPAAQYFGGKTTQYFRQKFDRSSIGRGPGCDPGSVGSSPTGQRQIHLTMPAGVLNFGMKKLLIGALCGLALSFSALAGQPHDRQGGHFRDGGHFHGGHFRDGGHYSHGGYWNGGRAFHGGHWFFRSGGYGWHTRSWWVSSGYTIIFFDGCWYYFDNGVYYPAYGYAADCYFDD